MIMVASSVVCTIMILNYHHRLANTQHVSLMIMVASSVVCTIMILNYHHRLGNTHTFYI
jgi:hypothetical protein